MARRISGWGAKSEPCCPFHERATRTSSDLFDHWKKGLKIPWAEYLRDINENLLGKMEKTATEHLIKDREKKKWGNEPRDKLHRCLSHLADGSEESLKTNHHQQPSSLP
jgi:hypothetical protein